MSNEAMNWAFSQPVSKSSAKFLLVAMANLAGTDGTCWPSAKHLSQATGQDIKTVESGLRRLREEGYITDTGVRRGTTGQVIVYRLNTPENGGVLPVANTPVFPSNTPEFGGVEEMAKTPVFPDNTPVFPVKDPQISRETPPKTGDGYQKDTKRTPKEPKEKSACALVVPDVPESVLADFLKIRKAKHAPLTETALRGLRREAEKAGKTLTEALEVCCERGWQGFKADWLADRPTHGFAAKPSTSTRSPSRHAGFEQLNYASGVNEDGTLAI